MAAPVLALLLLTAVSGDPATRKTLYRLCPYGVTGVANKNTADAGGSVGYYFMSHLRGCELSCQDNVFTSYLVESTGGWAHNYSLCNPQGNNMTAPYVCDNGDKFYIGAFDIQGACKPTTWYSTPVGGDCAAHTPCSWSLVETVKVINSTCLADRLNAAIEPYAKKCTERCPVHKPVPGSCQAICFSEAYDQLADKDHDLMCHLSQILVDAFASTDPAAGGCPART